MPFFVLLALSACCSPSIGLRRQARTARQDLGKVTGEAVATPLPFDGLVAHMAANSTVDEPPLAADKLTDRWAGAKGCPTGLELTRQECRDAAPTFGKKWGGRFGPYGYLSDRAPEGCWHQIDRHPDDNWPGGGGDPGQMAKVHFTTGSMPQMRGNPHLAPICRAPDSPPLAEDELDSMACMPDEYGLCHGYSMRVRYPGASGCPPEKQLTHAECFDAVVTLGLGQYGPNASYQVPQADVELRNDSNLTMGCAIQVGPWDPTGRNFWDGEVWFNTAKTGRSGAGKPICRAVDTPPLAANRLSDRRFINAAACPQGKDLSYWECVDAAKTLGIRFEGTAPAKDVHAAPSGCYRGENTSVYFSSKRATQIAWIPKYGLICQDVAPPLAADRLVDSDRLVGESSCPQGEEGLTEWQCIDAANTLGLEFRYGNISYGPTGCWKNTDEKWDGGFNVVHFRRTPSLSGEVFNWTRLICQRLGPVAPTAPPQVLMQSTGESEVEREYRVKVVDMLSAGYRTQPALLAATEQELGVKLLAGAAAEAAYADNAWSRYQGKRFVLTRFDIKERNAINTAMKALVTISKSYFDFTPSGSGYIEDTPLGLPIINYVVVGYASKTQRVVRADSEAKDARPDPNKPGELVHLTFKGGSGSEFVHEYKSKLKGRFWVTFTEV